jgi:hypothetical protein
MVALPACEVCDTSTRVGQWTSCSIFESPLQLCFHDAVLIEQLVSASLVSNDTSCLELMLAVASSSVSMNKAYAAAWMDGGLYRALVAAFAPQQATATRKLAFDLAFAIVNSRMSIETLEHSLYRENMAGDFGFERLLLDAGGAGCATAVREYQVASLFVVSARRLWCEPCIVTALYFRFCCPLSLHRPPRITPSCH